MPSVECKVPEFKLRVEKPHFRIVRDLPPGISGQLENAVRDFMIASEMPETVDKAGFHAQTLQAMAAASVLAQGGELWLGTVGNELWIYLLAHIGNDFDGHLAYTVSQAWVRKDQRGKPWVREVWEEVRQRAKNCLCKHFVVISTKGRTGTYCRFLGEGFKKYAEILKQEI